MAVSAECMDISACVPGGCLENLDAALPFLMLQISPFLAVDQLLPETQPSTIPSHSLNFVAVLFIYILFIFITFWFKNLTSLGLLLDVNLPAHHHGKENQMLSLHEKPLPRRIAVRAQQVQGRTGTALHWGRPHLPSTVPRQVFKAVVAKLHMLLLTNTEELQPLCLPFSQGTAVPGWG